MALNDYHFITRWRQPAPPEAVFTILEDAPSLVRWWPSVYLNVELINSGETERPIISLYTKGWLPYTLRWRFRVLESEPPRRLALEAHGDFVGRGVWTLT